MVGEVSNMIITIRQKGIHKVTNPNYVFKTTHILQEWFWPQTQDWVLLARLLYVASFPGIQFLSQSSISGSVASWPSHFYIEMFRNSEDMFRNSEENTWQVQSQLFIDVLETLWQYLMTFLGHCRSTWWRSWDIVTVPVYEPFSNDWPTVSIDSADWIDSND